jgi:ParB-like chromosome segregation protein Spo0J
MKKNIEQVDIAKLIPYVNNARVHSEDQVLQIASSIKEFGFNNPVLVDKENGIVAGHGRVMAAKKLGITVVPCIRLDHLTEAQRKAYIIADNKIALNSTWDKDLLMVEIDSLKELDIDLDLLGFDESELHTATVDYSLLNGDDVNNQVTQMADGTRKAIQIEFELNDYDEAYDLVKFWREQGAYVGGLIVGFLRTEKNKIASE